MKRCPLFQILTIFINKFRKFFSYCSLKRYFLDSHAFLPFLHQRFIWSTILPFTSIPKNDTVTPNTNNKLRLGCFSRDMKK